MSHAAAMMPEPSADEANATDLNGQYVTFRCDGRNYGIDIMSVREIRSWSPTTVLPDQPHGACGVLDIRGEVIQVFDLSAKLGGSMTEATEGHVVLVVAVDGAQVGILADSVSDIIEVSPADMREPPKSRGGRSGLLTGLAKHEDSIVAILDLSHLLGDNSF